MCPTNLGYVIAIDLLQNSLLWAYPYRDKADEVDDNTTPGVGMCKGRILPRGVMIPPNGHAVQPPPQQGWKVSAPIIQDGKVVFTAPDSKSIHCVNLKDGTPVWSKPRQEGDLYLGGVVNGKVIVVGQKVVRAYNLANGEKPWEAVETGLPSGFGAASENIYYVPLKEFGRRHGSRRLPAWTWTAASSRSTARPERRPIKDQQKPAKCPATWCSSTATSSRRRTRRCWPTRSSSSRSPR